MDDFEERGIEVKWVDGFPFADETLWDNAKRDYCIKHSIDLMYDDSPQYKETFNDIDTIYMHVINPTRKIYQNRQENNNENK